ncbi:hypothetical protein DW089_09260 [Acidaminococcus sp. AM05-11]|uniref:hypothetical protein n=1 Tax=Acidaminococcus sp. AM05-11 TaxID=2291997 RepID=UPI000E4802FA|nr:hypothetical protein [Acidaminococcus sp. AM05-11]RHK00869.1 hypothetical protein DW089_09260 [Acidaminococcus sp. AM05-11]
MANLATETLLFVFPFCWHFGLGGRDALLKWVQAHSGTGMVLAMLAFPFSLGYIFKNATER